MPFALTTPRLTLRPITLDDLDALWQIYRLDEVARFIPDDPWTREFAERKVGEKVPRVGLDSPAGALTAAVERGGVLIGEVLCWWTDRDSRTADIGWVIDPAHAGQGYATEAAGAVLRDAFHSHGARRVVARLDARNLASARVAEHLGMTREAHHRQDWWSKGEWTDTLLYAMLNTDQPALADSRS